MPGGRGHKHKGDTYERDLARFFNAHVPAPNLLGEARRATLSGGGHSDGGFDLTGPRLALGHGDYELGIEAKRTERLNIRDALSQAHRAKYKLGRAGADVSRIIPTVITRRNREPLEHSIVALRLEDFVTLMCGSPQP